MAVHYKHKRYFQIHEFYGDDSTRMPKSFTGTTAQAYAEFSFSSAFDTSSPTKTLAFEDSNKTLVVTYEFSSESDQTAFKNAVDTAYGNGTMWANDKGERLATIDIPQGSERCMVFHSFNTTKIENGELTK